MNDVCRLVLFIENNVSDDYYYSPPSRSLIEQLRKLQGMMKMSTMKTTTTSTCVMVRGLTHRVELNPHTTSWPLFGMLGISACSNLLVLKESHTSLCLQMYLVDS